MISISDARSPVKSTELSGSSTNSRGKRKIKQKYGTKKEEKRTESCPAMDRSCETISYRIYGNPNGEGFLIEARMYKGFEARHDRKRKERQAVYTVYIHEKRSEKLTCDFTRW